jgi:hypothetical protein
MSKHIKPQARDLRVPKPRAKAAPAKEHVHNPSAAAAVGPAGAAGETVSEEALAPAAALQAAESELGMNEWLDPETGEPAEGQSPPHLEEE